jgi:hypothetical protein
MADVQSLQRQQRFRKAWRDTILFVILFVRPILVGQETVLHEQSLLLMMSDDPLFTVNRNFARPLEVLLSVSNRVFPSLSESLSVDD